MYPRYITQCVERYVDERETDRSNPSIPSRCSRPRMLETDKGTEYEGFHNAIMNAVQKFNKDQVVPREFTVEDWVPDGVCAAGWTKAYATSIIRTFIPAGMTC